MAKKFDLSVIFRVTDKITRPVKKITKSMGDMTKSVNKFGLASKVAFAKVDRSLRRLDKRFEKAGKRIEKSGFTKIGKRMGDVGKDLTARLTLPLAILGGVITKRSIDFETAWTGVRKTVKASPAEFAKLKKELMALALELPVSTTELFNIAEAGGQMGIETKNLKAFTKAMADIGATTNLTTDEAATHLSRFSGLLGLTSDDYERLGSTIVDLGNNMETNEQEILNMSMRLLGAGKTVGLTADQILSLGASLISVGINAEAGGTAFSQVMKKIDKEIGTGSKKMQDFALISGRSVEDFEKAWKTDAANSLIDFTEGLALIQKEGGNVNIVLDDLGMEGIRVSNSLLLAAAGGDKFRKALKRGEKAYKDNIAMNEEAILRYGTAASKLKIARNRVDQLAASFGDILVPVILKVVELLKPVVEWLQNLDESTKMAIGAMLGFIALIGPLLIAVGAISVLFGAVGIAAAPILTVIGLITVLIGLGVILVKKWEPIKKFFIDTWKRIAEEIGKSIENLKNLFSDLIKDAKEMAKTLTSILPDFIKTKMGIEIGPARDLNDTSGLSDASKRLLGIPIENNNNINNNINNNGLSNTSKNLVNEQINQSKTQIDLKVSADAGSTVNTERVLQKKGKSNVNLTTVGYVGAGM